MKSVLGPLDSEQGLAQNLRKELQALSAEKSEMQTKVAALERQALQLEEAGGKTKELEEQLAAERARLQAVSK